MTKAKTTKTPKPANTDTDTRSTASKSILPLIALVIVVAVLALGRTSATTPEQAGSLFCKAGSQAFLAKHLFTPELKTAWAEAEAKNDAWAKAHPGEKPPFGDGIPLAGFPDKSPVCETAKPTEKYVEIHHKFPNEPKSDWTDRLVLKLVGKKYLIDDIQFAPHGTLRNRLKHAF